MLTSTWSRVRRGRGASSSTRSPIAIPQHTLVVADRLGDLASMPVQIIWCEQDAWRVVGWAHKLHAAIQGSILHVLPDCGHFALKDRPEALANFVIEFTAHNA